MNVFGIPQALFWSCREDDKEKAILYILCLNDKLKNGSFISRNDISISDDLVVDSDYKINRNSIQSSSFRIEERCFDMVLGPNSLSPGHEVFYLSTANSVKVFQARNALVVGDKITLDKVAMEFKDHIKGAPHLGVSTSGEWLLTWAQDGILTARSLIEPEKTAVIYSHDLSQDGIAHASFTRDCRHIITIGKDGILKRFDWKFAIQAARRAAIEATEAAAAFASENMESAQKIRELLKNKSLTDIEDNPDERHFLASKLDKLNDEAKSHTNTV